MTMTKSKMTKMAAESTASPSVRIDDVDYALDSLSPEARQQLANLQATDQELARVQSLAAMLQAARLTYADLLRKALPKPVKRTSRTKAK